MIFQISHSNLKAGILTFDIDGVSLGPIVEVYGSSDPFLDEVISALAFARLDPPAATLLQHEGCFVVDTGLHTGNYHVLPSQIRKIVDRCVFLTCNRTELIQI